MIIELSIQGNGGRRSTVNVTLDFSKSAWSVKGSVPPDFKEILANKGSFDLKSHGSMWLEPGPGADRNMRHALVFLINPPRSGVDKVHRSGRGEYGDRWGIDNSPCTWRVVSTSRASTSAMSKVRRRMVQVCLNKLPKEFDGFNYFAGRKKAGTASDVTNCNVFVGTILHYIPLKKKKVAGEIPAAMRMNWQEYANRIDREKHPAKPTFITYGAGLLPKPGDIYMLRATEGKNAGGIQHIGIVLNASGSEWTTADGGQRGDNDSYACRRRKRKLDRQGVIQGESGASAAVIGWVDLDRLASVIPEVFPPGLVS